MSANRSLPQVSEKIKSFGRRLAFWRRRGRDDARPVDLAEDSLIGRLTGAAMLTVGLTMLLSFYLSYESLWHYAANSGKEGQAARLWPLIIDVPVVGFSVLTVLLALLGKSAWLLRLGVAGATGATVYFNYRYAVQAGNDWLVAVAAPVMYFASFEALLYAYQAVNERKITVRGLKALVRESVERQIEVDNLTANIGQLEESYQDKDGQLEVNHQAKIEQLEANYQERVGQLEASYRDKARQLEASIEARAGQLDELQQAIGQAKQAIATANDELAEVNALVATGQVRVYLPDNLDIDQRRSLVGQMDNDGLTNEAMSQVLGVSVGTIKNDKAALRQPVNGKVPVSGVAR